MKDKILKLLDSYILEDVLIAVQLLYSLDKKDFLDTVGKGTVSRRLNLRAYGHLYYKFQRYGAWYSFGCVGIGKFTGLTNITYIDITPQDYEGENT